MLHSGVRRSYHTKGLNRTSITRRGNAVWGEGMSTSNSGFGTGTPERGPGTRVFGLFGPRSEQIFTQFIKILLVSTAAGLYLYGMTPKSLDVLDYSPITIFGLFF